MSRESGKNRNGSFDPSLESIPGIGPSLAGALRSIGIDWPEDLKGKNPETLFQELCDLEGKQVDRCVLYTFRCAVYYAGNQEHDPELLKWWNWKDRQKK